MHELHIDVKQEQGKNQFLASFSPTNAVKLRVYGYRFMNL